MRINRRALLKNAGLASGAAWFGAAYGSGKFLSTGDPSPSSAVLPNPTDSGIEHIVVVTMENVESKQLAAQSSDGWLLLSCRVPCNES